MARPEAPDVAVHAPKTPASSWNVLLVVTVMCLCFMGVILISKDVLIHKSLRLDESQSLWQASHSIRGLFKVVAEDVHVPMYHLMLHFWIMYFGDAVPTIRILSLIFFLLTIPLVYLLARQVLSLPWSLVAVVLFSFSPFMNWYGNEARMYTLLAFFATLSQYYFIRIIKGEKVWFRYGLTAVVGAYSHYFFSFNLLTEGLYFLLYRKRFPPGTFKRLFLVGVLVALALAPWLYYFHSLGSASNTTPQLPVPSAVDFFNVYSQFLFGFQDNYINTIIVSCWPIIMLIALLAVQRNQKASPELGFLAMMAFVPVILSFVLSHIITPFFVSRYMISSVAPLIILIVWLISYYGKRLAILVTTVLLLAIIPASYQQAVSAYTPVKENYRGAADLIMKEAKPQDAVVISTPFTLYPFEYYYHGRAQIYTLPLWNQQDSGAIPAYSRKTLPIEATSIDMHHHYIFLLLSYNQGYENGIRQYYLHHYPLVHKTYFSPDLNLYVFKVGYETVPPLGSPKTVVSAYQASQ